jgi:hypothetical protein
MRIVTRRYVGTKTGKGRTAARCLIICGLLVLGAASGALGNPTQEDVFRSLNQNMNTPVDMSRAVPYLLAALGVIILVILFNYHRQRQNTPRSLNHPGKLSRELARRLGLRSIELRQLKLLAEEQELEHPLTLILCPSVLGKAIKSPSVRVDRAVLKQIVKRLRTSLTASR